MVKSLKWDCVGHSPLNQTFRDLSDFVNTKLWEIRKNTT